MKITDIVSEQLVALRETFVRAGFDMWVVGGACRDALSGREPKDIDLATSATPDEQVAIYAANGIRYIPTGLQHGTVSVVLDDTYEITSLRTETDHDGRWATVAYTRDIAEDLSRRDLTINAMALSFDDVLIDPFGGKADLEAKRVRFVGDAEERMREDYLRILRFFRFHARFAGDADLDPAAVQAIKAARGGLAQISVERVWMEMSKIVTGPAGAATLMRMMDLSLFEIIGMPMGMLSNVQRASDRGITDPASMMGCYVFEPGDIEGIATMWKWSGVERERASFMAQHAPASTTLSRLGNIPVWKEMLVDGIPFEWVSDLMRLADIDPAELASWDIPKMPVTGGDLIKAGVKPGPQMGDMLKRMQQRWKDSDYTLTKEELLV